MFELIAPAVAVGMVLTAVYFLASEPLVRIVFSSSYSDPGIVLGLVGFATTLYAAISIWLNYALSLQKNSFVIGLAVLALLVIVARLADHPDMTAIATIMIGAGIAGNVLGAITTLREPAPTLEETQAPLF